jgi:zinc transporter 11
VLLIDPVLPFALSFAAGAMMFVVFDDILPEAQQNSNGKLVSFGAMIGFIIMMCLEVGLG